MEERIQKLVQVLEKNSTWRWLGYNTLLGDSSTSQYAGLKIFVRYVLDKRTSLIDQREDKGVNFTSTGGNPICRDFIKYLQKKAEETGDEREKAQLLWMANRAEAMMQMQDPSLGQMNDGIFLAHAFTFIALGEKASPRVEVTEDSIVGLLENGLTLSRKGKPELGNVVDFVEGKTKELALPTPATSAPAPAPQGGTPAATYGTATGGATSYTQTTTGKTEKTEVPPKEVSPKEKSDAPKEEPKKEAGLRFEEGEKPAGKVDISITGEEEMGEELLFQTPETAGRRAVAGKRAAKGGPTKVEEKVKVPEGTKIQRPVIDVGKGQRKKVSKKKRIQQVKDEAGKRERQRVPQGGAPQPTQGQAGRRQPIPSGGWKIAKSAGKIAAGGGTGAGIIGWAVSAGSDAVASTFASTVAFIHTLF